MAVFFKTLGFGVLYIVLLPAILLALVLFALYCTITFMIQAVRNVIVFFSGGTIGGDLKEDVEAKKILLERQAAQTNQVPPVSQQTTNNQTTNQTVYIFSNQNAPLPSDLFNNPQNFQNQLAQNTPQEIEHNEEKPLEIETSNIEEGKDDDNV